MPARIWRCSDAAECSAAGRQGHAAWPCRLQFWLCTPTAADAGGLRAGIVDESVTGEPVTVGAPLRRIRTTVWHGLQLPHYPPVTQGEAAELQWQSGKLHGAGPLRSMAANATRQRPDNRLTVWHRLQPASHAHYCAPCQLAVCSTHRDALQGGSTTRGPQVTTGMRTAAIGCLSHSSSGPQPKPQ